MTDIKPKTMISDSKTMDRHMVKCPHVDDRVMTWAKVGIGLKSKRVSIDGDIYTTPDKRQKTGMGNFIDRPMTHVETGTCRVIIL